MADAAPIFQSMLPRGPRNGQDGWVTSGQVDST